MTSGSEVRRASRTSAPRTHGDENDSFEDEDGNGFRYKLDEDDHFCGSSTKRIDNVSDEDGEHVVVLRMPDQGGKWSIKIVIVLFNVHLLINYFNFWLENKYFLLILFRFPQFPA